LGLYDRGVTVNGRVPARVFGEVAEEYDRVRLSYPVALVDDVLEYSRLEDSGRRALEVGAGTGKATRAFAARGVPIVAVEPDTAMAAILARHVAHRPDVHIVQSSFEEYQPDEGFGLLYCADAWHWTQPEVRWSLAGQALAAGGVLALFWNFERIDDSTLRQAMLDVIAEIVPTIVISDAPPPAARLLTEWPANELAERPEFSDLIGRIYPSRKTFSGADYVTQISTRSQLRMLPESTRVRLLAALAEVFDDVVTLTIDTVLYLARRKPEPS
jgi:SAM-dependent methyltransferase